MACCRWRPMPSRGFRYRASRFAASGIDTIDLKYASRQQAQIDVMGRGPGLRLPAFDAVEPPVVVQLVTGPAPTVECWEATYDEVEVRPSGRLQASR